MIGDNDIKPLRRLADKSSRTDAAVYCYQKMISFLCQMVHCLPVQTIPFLFSLGNVVSHIRSKGRKAAHHDGSRCNPIDIVVPIHYDFFMLIYGLQNAAHRFVHALHEERI